MFLRQFRTRIGEELLKAKHLSESAKPWTELQRHTTCTKWIGDVAESQTNPPRASSLWIELHRHTVLHKVDLTTHNHQRLCSRIADPKPGARGPISPNKGPKQLFLLVSVVETPHRLQ